MSKEKIVTFRINLIKLHGILYFKQCYRVEDLKTTQGNKLDTVSWCHATSSYISRIQLFHVGARELLFLPEVIGA